MKNQVDKNENNYLKQALKEIRKVKKEMTVIQEDVTDIMEEVGIINFKSRKDIPFIFISQEGNHLFKTFNLNVMPVVGHTINLRPTPGSCCLNAYLMGEFDLTEKQVNEHISSKSYFSFIVNDITTNITVMDSHPDNEFDDDNAMNFIDEDYNMVYLITLIPNNKISKQVLVEKI